MGAQEWMGKLSPEDFNSFRTESFDSVAPKSYDKVVTLESIACFFRDYPDLESASSWGTVVKNIWQRKDLISGGVFATDAAIIFEKWRQEFGKKPRPFNKARRVRYKVSREIIGYKV